jgi:hypothetical protein
MKSSPMPVAWKDAPKHELHKFEPQALDPRLCKTCWKTKAAETHKAPAKDARRARLHRALDAVLGHDAVKPQLSAKLIADIQAEYNKLKGVNLAIVRGTLARKFGGAVADEFLRTNADYMSRMV